MNNRVVAKRVVQGVLGAAVLGWMLSKGSDTFLSFTIVGIFAGCTYALAAIGVVVTYTTSGIFNFAHGGIGMVLAFLYWDLNQDRGLPAPVALVLVLFVAAPLLGALIERVLMRQLHGSSTGTSLVVTLGLLLTLLGVGNSVWDPSVPRSIPEFFAGRSVPLFGVNVTYHQLIAVLVAIGVAIGLRFFFYRTRLGIAMRAVVDDPELAALNGATPARVAQASWALGSMLAGLSFILIAPTVRLEVIVLALLVLNAFAATVVGRLKSLPLTFIGAVALGLLVSYAVGYFAELPGGDSLTRIQPALPTIFLFVALLVAPQARLRAGRVLAIKSPRLPTLKESMVGGALLVAATFLVTGLLSRADNIAVGRGLALALIMLSLVLLTGFGGQVSLCQLTFVGLGAFVFGKVAATGNPAGIIPAVLVAAAVGAVVALFAVRLSGLYLALATLAFAQAMDFVFFQDSRIFGFGGRLPVARLSAFGFGFETDRSYIVFVSVIVALAGVGILALRRGPFGRRLSAMRDSPAACATLGLNQTTVKLLVFSLSAGLAGLAGVFFGGLKTSVGPTDFEMLQSLVLLLLVTIGGINTVSGALLGGMLFALFPVLQEHVELFSTGSLQFLGVGLGALSLGRNPNGMAGQLAELGERIRARFDARRRPPSGTRVELDDMEVEPLARAAS